MSSDLPFFAAFLGGILSFISPCVLPLVPGYLSFVAGIRIEDADKNTPLIKTKLLMSSLLFVMGFSLVFIALGAGASGIAELLRQYQSVFTKIAGIAIIIMGLHMMGVFKIAFLYREFRVNPDISEARSVLTPFLLGLAFGMGWTPCIGPVLAGVLILASQQETIVRGMVMLSVYAAGLGIPFIIAALGLGYFQQKSGFLKKHLGIIEKIAGLFLTLTGIFIFSNHLQNIGTFLIGYIPFLGKLG